MSKRRLALPFFILLAAAAAGTLVLAIPSAEYRPNKPNIVIISIDSLRADHMGIYGYARDTTPRIDAYAQGAAVFDNYFSTSPITPISAASVQTGQYPLRNGIINFETNFAPGVATLAETLQQEGWRTAAFGSSPELLGTLRASFSQGFDTFSVYKKLPEVTESGVPDFLRSAASSVGIDLAQAPQKAPMLRRNAIPVAEATTWIREGGEKPFYLWFSIGSVHWPYGSGIPNRFSSADYSGFLDAERFQSNPLNKDIPLFQGLYGRIYGGALYNSSQTIVSTELARDIAHLIDSYDDGVSYTDRQLGPLLALLSSPAYRTNTIVIIESEHGEDLGEHGYIAHYDVLGTQTHVPLIIRGPGVLPGRVAGLASGVDVAPTLYDLLDLSHKALDGVSQIETITEGTPARDAVFLTRTPLWERIIAYSEPWLQPFVSLDNKEHFYDTAIRTDEWLLVHRRSREILHTYSWYGRLSGKPIALPEYELYSVANDPFELQDVYAEHAGDVAPLRARLSLWEREMAAVAPGPQAEEEGQPYF